MDQNQPALYAILTQRILGDKNLNHTDKIVLARISGFEKFFESAKATADFCGMTERQVADAKRKLEKLGYIQCVENTGRGKAYRTAPNYLWQGRPTEKRISDLRQNVEQTYDETYTYNKERLNYITLKGDEAVAESSEIVEKAGENSAKTYGNADINQLKELWSEEVGTTIDSQAERRQLYNLIRKYGLEGAQSLVKRVGASRRANDRFAPVIAKPSDLTGKYSKLPRLEAWEQRQALPPEPPKNQPAPLPGGYMTRVVPDYGGAFDPLSDEERADVLEKFKKARETLPFLKNRKEDK